jgi:hypothetical protein
MHIHRIVTRVLAAAAVATALTAIMPLFSPAISADSSIAYQPPVVEPPATIGFQTSTPSADEVVLDDFTPPAPRAGQTRVASNDMRVAVSSANSGYNAADDFKAGPGCSIQCITSGFAYARGVGAKLVVKTDTPAQIWIIVWDNEGYNTMVDSGITDVTQFGHVFDDLEPGHTYQAMAVAEDAQGYSSHAYGDFTTLNRYVEISMSSADILTYAFSPDTFSKSVWANGEWLDQYEAHSLELQDSMLNWGDNQILLSHVGRYLELAVQLEEGDDDPDDLCEATGPFDEPTLGPISCGYVAYAELQDGDNDLDHRPANATSWTEHTLHRMLRLPGGALPPGYGSPLDFTVDVTLHVIYQ